MKWDKYFSFCVGSIGAVGNYLWGGWDMALQTLIGLMILDYITGIICAGKDQMFSSAIGFRGLGKKVVILIVVAVAVLIDRIIGTNGIARSLVIFFYASMEGISILENAARVGVPVPDKLKEMLVQLKEGNKKGIKEVER